MRTASDLCASAAVLSALYVLISLGWVVVFRSTRVLNFASGEMLVLPAFGFFVLYGERQLPLAVSLIGTLGISAALGAVIYTTFLRPLAGQPVFAPIILTVGISVILASLISIIWGPTTRALPFPVDRSVVNLPGGGVVSNYRVGVLFTGLVVYLLAMFASRRTRAGVQMRATAENPLLASQSGVNINRVSAASWGVAAAFLALAGIASGYTTVLAPANAGLALRGIAPAIIGGLDSIGGVLAGSVIVAVIETLATHFLGAEVSDAAAFLALLLMLTARPYGLFGSQEIRRV